MLVKDLIRRRSWLAKTAWMQAIERSNVKQSAAVHLTSQIEAAELERFGWKLPRLRVIPNGIGAPLAREGPVAPDISAIAAEQPLVLFLGRLSWKKGLDRLLRGFARTGLGKLAIVGTDDENLTPQLLKMAEDLRIGDRVRFLPRTVAGQEKEHLFGAAKVFVLSSYSENFGNTVLEAMQRGIAVVVTPEVGAAEMVRESGGGLVVGGDPETLGAAIARLIEDCELSRTMGLAGERYVFARYTWERVAAEMECLYSTIRPPSFEKSSNAIHA